MARVYNEEVFTANINGEVINFYAHTTSTRNGFCHTIECNGVNTKVSYCNRTWERFRYETALYRAIDKFPKSMREELTAQLIEKKAKADEERCNAFVKAFSNLHSSLSDENKKRLANSGIEINSEEDANAVMGLMGLMKVME